MMSTFGQIKSKEHTFQHPQWAAHISFQDLECKHMPANICWKKQPSYAPSSLGKVREERGSRGYTFLFLCEKCSPRSHSWPTLQPLVALAWAYILHFNSRYCRRCKKWSVKIALRITIMIINYYDCSLKKQVDSLHRIKWQIKYRK